MKSVVIDGTGMILGRLASKVAKSVLLGNKVDIVNCEQVMISGKKKVILDKYKRWRTLGVPLQGPYFPRLADRFVRRIIRGMLPNEKARGREAFKRVMCYKGVPDAFKEKKLETFKDIHISKVPSLYNVSVGEICKLLGGK